VSTTKEQEEGLVRAFSKVMLEKLAKNRDRKGHWSRTSLGYLTGRVHDEARELSRAVQRGAPPEEIAREAADVANFAAMVARVAGGI